jgi:hypothetical protein
MFQGCIINARIVERRDLVEGCPSTQKAVVKFEGFGHGPRYFRQSSLETAGCSDPRLTVNRCCSLYQPTEDIEVVGKAMDARNFLTALYAFERYDDLLLGKRSDWTIR